MQVLLALGTFCLVAGFVPGLYGMVDNMTSGQVNFINVNTKTGVQTPLAALWKVEGVAQALATVDQKNGIYYVLGFDGLRVNVEGWNVSDGKAVSKAEVPAFRAENIIGLGQGIAWEPDTGALVAVGRDKLRSLKIGLLDPKTGDFTQKAYLNNSGDKYVSVVPSDTVYVPETKEMLMQLATNQPPVSYYLHTNLDTGNISLTPNCTSVGLFSYDSVTKTIFGLSGIEDDSAPNGYVLTLAQMKTDASECTNIANISGYAIMDVGTLDTQGRVFYFVTSPCVKKGDPGCLGEGPFDLVGVSVESGKIVSVAPKFCDFVNDTCPWSLEFANPL